ncbi:MAG: AbrB family transcriptional regulator [Rubricella sp.]
MRIGGIGAFSATVALAAAGAFLFLLMGFPVPFLTGPALIVSLAAMVGVPVVIPAGLRDACFIVLGLGIGSSITQDVVLTAARWPLSLAILAVCVVASLKICDWILRRVFRYDPLTALLASTPGHLSFALALSVERGADSARVGMVQGIRVLFLTLCVPPMIGIGLGDVALPAGRPEMALPHLAALAAAALALGLVFLRLRVPAAYLLAAMAVSATGHLAGVTPGTPPFVLTALAFVTMGALIGARFRGMTPTDLRGVLLAGIAVTGVTVVFAGLGALATMALLGLPVRTLLVAFAPGGLEAMAAIAVELGLNPALVAAHHVWRLVFLSVLVPWLVLRLDRRMR